MKVLIADLFSPAAIDEMKKAGIEVAYNDKLSGETLTAELAKFQPNVLVVRSTKVVVADIDASVMTYQCNALPCITATRASNGGYWLEWQGRRTSLKELVRAQGMDPDRVQQVTSARTLGHAIGNAMTQTVMQNIVKKLLPAVGFAV